MIEKELVQTTNAAEAEEWARARCKGMKGAIGFRILDYTERQVALEKLPGNT